jgi:hypothetical protein
VHLFDNNALVGNSADKGKYFCDDGESGGIADDGLKNGGEYMMTPWGVKSEPGWPKTACTAAVVPLAQATVNFGSLHDFGDATAFRQQVDNSLAGQMRDCGECHIGGGAMEYIPVAQGTDLTDPNAATLSVLDYDGPRAALRPGYTNSYANDLAEFNGYNYFIDQYDENADGNLGEVLSANYADSGVMEMDCLVCHLDGYSWTDRTATLREGKLDTSRVVGAGLGTDSYTGVARGTNYGKTVDYSPTMVESDSGNATLTALALASIDGTPPDANCSSCHFDMHQVDWKKRGASWSGIHNNEVHSAVGCMGCHTNADAIASGATDADNSLLTGVANGTPGHDPGKGKAPFSSLWNKRDNDMVRTCAYCHANATLGAPDPTDAHIAAGLSATIVQSGRDGTVDASHLDIMGCEACHTRKLGHGPTAAEGGTTHGSLYEWGTGAAMVDATAPDLEGRLTDHESLYIERTMESNMARSWYGGKLRNKHSLITMFWRDKHEDFNSAGSLNYFDANADGVSGAMDAVNPMHVRAAMDEAGLHPLVHDGTITATTVNDQRTALFNYLTKDDGSLPGTTSGDGISDTLGKDWTDINNSGNSWSAGKLKLSFMGVLFLANHNTSPKESAWGANGCGDCHGDSKGFYNGTYELKGRDLDVSFAAGDAVPYTKVNKADYDGDGGTVTVGTEKADYQMTDFHPTMFAKGLTFRTIALQVASASGSTTLRDVDRSEFMYENDSTLIGAPGARTMVDGTVAAGRTDIVANLNEIGAGEHDIHIVNNVACVSCHYGTTDSDPADGDAGTGTYGIVADPAEPFTWVAFPGGVGGTCSTSACHGTVGASEPADWNNPNPNLVVDPDVASLYSMTENYKIDFDGTFSRCYELVDGAVVQRTCTMTWDFESDGSVDGSGPHTSTFSKVYPAAGSYDVTVVMTESVTGLTATETFAVEALEPMPVAATSSGFDATPNLIAGGTGTTNLAVGDLATDVAKVYIFWGDRSRTVLQGTTALDAFRSGGVDHTYSRAGTYDITVYTLNTGALRLVYQGDAAMTVVVSP